MNLVSFQNDINIEFQENWINVLCIENKLLFRNVVGDLKNLTSGSVGQFKIYHNNQEMNASKILDFIETPFSIELNNKKIANAISAELIEISRNELYIESTKINAKICEYLFDLIEYTDYNLELSTEMNLQGLLKCYEVRIADSDMDVLERMIEYVKAMHRICGTTMFAFLNLKQYLTEDELEEFYKAMFYEKVDILLVEGNYIGHNDAVEKVVIIDEDLCKIYP